MNDTVDVRGLGRTRARVLSLLQDADEELTAAEVGSRLALHVNSARFHLDRLADEGLVVRQREARSTPGRPKMLYRSSAAAPPAHRSYRLLAEILTGALTDQLPEPSTAAREAGEAWGRLLVPPAEPGGQPATGDALETLVSSMDRLGFDSHVVIEPDSMRVEVSHCPFLEVAVDHHDVVCSVHLGLMRGVLEQTAAPITAESLEPLVEPSRCIAHLAPSPAAAG